MRAAYRTIITFFTSLWANMFGGFEAQSSITVPVADGTPAAVLAGRGMFIAAKGDSQRTGNARYTKWHLDRDKRDTRNRIASASRARNRGT